MRLDCTRRALLALAATSSLPPLGSRAALAATSFEDLTRLKGLEDKSVQQYDLAPLTGLQRTCLSAAGKQQSSMADYLAKGQYVVLWIFPADEIGLERSNNELEARNFQKLKADFDDLDAVVLGVTSQPEKRVRELIEREKLTIPFFSDPSRELIRAYTNADDRVTFVIDPQGTVRFAERNIQYNVGNFNLENHATRVSRQLYQIRNRDGWAV